MAAAISAFAIAAALCPPGALAAPAKHHPHKGAGKHHPKHGGGGGGKAAGGPIGGSRKGPSARFSRRGIAASGAWRGYVLDSPGPFVYPSGVVVQNTSPGTTVGIPFAAQIGARVTFGCL